ncbi:MAG TPA: GTP 3',8-cyclase MoaA, partial [Steroidobacteraceae bacterium]|nr:GTP 3',8-cyclase MoaA [Steroidobacteraceae bacterium]
MTDNIPGSLVSIDAPRAATDQRGRPLLDLRISVMDRCNFRCPYCMPRETFGEGYRFLPAAERLSFDEILRLARAFAAEGVRKIRLTGGEPLLRTGLADLVGELSAIDGIEDLALTTNGVLLAQHAAELAAQGLSRVTVSLDSIDPATFRRMNGGFDGLDRVLDGIRAAREAGLAPVKVNAVVQRGVNDGQVRDLAEHFRGSGVVVRFIEYMDVGNRNHWLADLVVPSREIRDAIGAAWPLQPLAAAHAGEVAERYAYADGRGEIGFISSVTQPFCGGCTRARLSS